MTTKECDEQIKDKALDLLIDCLPLLEEVLKNPRIKETVSKVVN